MISHNIRLLCVGVFQAYLDKNVFGENGSQVSNARFQLSFVGTLSLCFEHLMAPLSEVIRSTRGAKTVLFLGGLLIFSGLTAASFAKEVSFFLYIRIIYCVSLILMTVLFVLIDTDLASLFVPIYSMWYRSVIFIFCKNPNICFIF